MIKITPNAISLVVRRADYRRGWFSKGQSLNDFHFAGAPEEVELIGP
jgi:hypothetical protein